jgi:hypothetical protein
MENDTLRGHWQPEEEARFDRLWTIAGLLTDEQNALQASNSGSLSEAALVKTFDLALQVIYIERQRLISLAEARREGTSTEPPPPTPDC